MRKIINKIQIAIAVLCASKQVVFIENEDYVIRYVFGLTEEEIKSLTDIDYEK